MEVEPLKDRILLFITNSGNTSIEESSITTTINNYTSYFKSPYGGSWTEEEIFILNQPDLNYFSESLEYLDGYSQCIIIYCGPVYKKHDGYVLKLNEEDDFDSKLLYKNKEKCLVIIDDFKDINRTNDEALFNRLKPFNESLHALVLNQWDCKKYYITKNVENENQHIVVYSIGTPVSKKLGSYYASFLLKQARIMVGDTYKSIDFKKSIGYVRFLNLHKEVLDLMKTYNLDTNKIEIITSQNITSNTSFIFSIIA